MPDSPLQRELQQPRPFASVSQEGVLAILRTADLLRHQYERVMAPVDITLQQYNVLRILRGAGPDGLPTLAIGTRMVERSPGVTRLIDRLEARGLVQRARSDGDRRQVVCSITAEGLTLLARLDPAIRTTDDAALDMLDEDEQQQLVALLDRVRAAHAERLSR